MPPSAPYSPKSSQAPESLTGVVERITYHAEESGYTVARIQSPRVRELSQEISRKRQLTEYYEVEFEVLRGDRYFS